MISIDASSPTPLAEQIRRAVRRDIAEGRLRAGSSLPPVRKVAAAAGVNLNTVARAYRALEEEGLVSAVRGRGTEVVAVRERHGASRRDLELRARDLAADASLGGHDARVVRSLLR